MDHESLSLLLKLSMQVILMLGTAFGWSCLSCTTSANPAATQQQQ
jgi:hypothetical protein